MKPLSGSVVFILALACAAPVALASEPVPRVIEGCVNGGVFTSSDGYVIRPQLRIGELVDLARFEGRAIILDGDLLPGDLMILKKPPQDKGPCAQ